MSAKNHRYKSGSMSWTPEDGSAVSLDGVQGINFGEGGSTIPLESDANEIVEALPVASISARITLTGINQAVAMDLALGKGALSFDTQQVRTGRGAASGEDKTYTFSNCVLVSKTADVGHQAGGTYTLEFEAADNGSDATYAVS